LYANRNYYQEFPLIKMVPKVGLEPTRLAPPPPQDGVSTNFTTSAYLFYLLLVAGCNALSVSVEDGLLGVTADAGAGILLLAGKVGNTICRS
jgi:hypothetical protein